jgi:CRP-like cAMP-binding protein
MRLRRQHHDEQLEWLAGHPLWSSLSRDELSRIAALGVRRQVPTGHVLMVRGEQGHEAALIVDGEVAVMYGGQVKAWLGAGDLVGELSLLDGAPRNADVRTASDVELLVLDEDGLRAALDDIAPLRERVTAIAAQRRPRPAPPVVDEA